MGDIKPIDIMNQTDIRLSVNVRSFKYPDGTLASSGVAINVRRGEFIGLLGANGSGKTTLLKIMDGLLKDYDGYVLLDGTDIKKLSPRDIYKKVGFVFQNPDNQLFAPTVYEDVAFGPLNMGFSEKETDTRIHCALKDVEMEKFAGKPIQNLSFGEKKRICIAGLLAMGHEILLLDEPTSGLDPMGEYKMMSLLAKLNKEKNVTIAMATHSVDLLPIFLDRLYILSNGQIVREGIPENIFTAPEDMDNIKLRMPQVAEFIYRLKHEDKIPFEKIPLTIGDARREILKTFRKHMNEGEAN